MKLFFVLLFLAASSYAAADNSSGKETITINGKTYSKGFKSGHKKRGAVYFKPAMRDTPIPDTYDAVAAGAATPVKNPGQGSCGDCWAWSRMSALEAATILASTEPKTISLSEEDTTDNASDEDGCGGGEMDFNYEVSHGVSLSTTCPWAGGGRGCTSVPVAQGYKMAYIGDENGPTDAELTSAVYQFGSVSVTVAAGGSFTPDANGQITDCGSRSIDHMVSLVGFKPGASSGSVLYKMKNSWGTDWGVNGYAYMALGCDAIATGSQSAMVVYVKGSAPVVDLQLPVEIISTSGQAVPIQIPAQTADSLTWSNSDTGNVVWVAPTASTSYTVTATDASGAKTSSTVLVTISVAKG